LFSTTGRQANPERALERDNSINAASEERSRAYIYVWGKRFFEQEPSFVIERIKIRAHGPHRVDDLVV
jgi:hypothetical protein